MLVDVNTCIDGVAMTTPTAPTPLNPTELRVQLAQRIAGDEFQAVQQLCPGWQACPHHNRIVGRYFGRALAMGLIHASPRRFDCVGGLVVPSWS